MDDSATATKGDIKWLYSQITNEMKTMHKSLYQADDQILTVLSNVNDRLTDKVENHERRLRKLEEQVV